jgi:hypothetical protein
MTEIPILLQPLLHTSLLPSLINIKSDKEKLVMLIMSPCNTLVGNNISSMTSF